MFNTLCRANEIWRSWQKPCLELNANAVTGGHPWYPAVHFLTAKLWLVRFHFSESMSQELHKVWGIIPLLHICECLLVLEKVILGPDPNKQITQGSLSIYIVH